MPSSGEGHHVAVIVLGDVGRSPRMQYHALSLLQNPENRALCPLPTPIQALIPSKTPTLTLPPVLPYFWAIPHPLFLRSGVPARPKPSLNPPPPPLLPLLQDAKCGIRDRLAQPRLHHV